MCIYIYIHVCVCVRMCLSGKAESCNGSVVKFIVQEEAVHSKELLPSAFIASLLYWQGQKNYTTFPDSIDCFFFFFLNGNLKCALKQEMYSSDRIKREVLLLQHVLPGRNIKDGSIKTKPHKTLFTNIKKKCAFVQNFPTPSQKTSVCRMEQS